MKNFSSLVTPVYHDTVTGEAVMNVAGSVTIPTNGFNIPAYDYVGVNTTSSTTQDVYTFYIGGSSGTLLNTITLTYSDATTKNILISVAKS